MKLEHNKLIMDGAGGWDIKKAASVVRIYHEIPPSFFGSEQPAHHELSCCSWIGAAKPVAWLHFKPPITMFVQVFETVDYLTFHLPWDLEIFTESVFMYDICCIQIIERDLNICVLGT